MARAQMLYIGKQGAVSYPAIGNIAMGSGSAGTIALWYHAANDEQWCNIISATIDGSNYLALGREKTKWYWQSRSSAVPVTVETISPGVAWRHVVATWDFSGGPGAGVLRLYLDGQEVAGSPVSTASAPLGVPGSIILGPGEANVRPMAHAVMDQLAILSQALSAQQVAALHALGREHEPQASDGSGSMLLAASWNEQFDADVAEGSGVATLLGAADQYCRLDCRSRHDGKRFAYRIGTPKHDGSADDRVPVFAVLPPWYRGTVTGANAADYGRIDVNANGIVQEVGCYLAPWLPAPAKPMTLRVGAHVLTMPASWAHVAVGAQDYYHGNSVALVTGAGCTASTIASTALTQADNYWAGAELHVLGGTQRGQKLRIAGNSQANHTLTLQGALGEALPSGVSLAAVHPTRIQPWQTGGETYRLECNLRESYGGVERFGIVETSIIGDWGYSRINLGRIQQYPFQLAREGVFFGKRTGTYADYQTSILVERLEMDGPGAYEVTTNTDDTFLVSDPASGESVKVARAEGVERELRAPAQCMTPAAVQAAMAAPGTWRHTIAYCPSWMSYDARNDRLVAVLVGTDSSGVQRVGYVHGTWNEALGIVEWADDPDPRNPFLGVAELEAVLGGRSTPYNRLVRVNGAFEVEERDWALVFTATLGDPDGYTTCALTGAPDRYSFDPALHFDPEANPITPPLGGDDKVVPEGSGIGLLGNRDCEVLFTENPWARRRADRFWGYGRAKTIGHAGTTLWYQPARPLSCVVTGDFRNLRHVPWRNQVVAPAWGWFHWPHAEWYQPSTVTLAVDDGGVTQSDVGLWAAEDGVHFQRALTAIPRNTPPFNNLWLMPQANSPRLGKRRLYWYREDKSGNSLNLASIRLDGEALYRLSAGELIGELETCSLQRAAAWEQLRLNVDPQAGMVTVAVLDAETGALVPGFDHGDCNVIGEGVELRVTWRGVGLSEVPHERIRLLFRVTRPSAASASPELYAWRIAAAPGIDRPWASAAQVEGRVNPCAIANPAPVLSWRYEDYLARPQSAWQVLVASTQEKLDAKEGDLWDSGVVLAEETQAKYEGAPLESERTYFWKVRVRNSEGVWSEEW